MLVRTPKRLAVLVWGLSISACPSDESTSSREEVAPRADDPPLTHTWSLPPHSSRVGRGLVGSKPPAVADALMERGRLPGIVHRVADACEGDRALPEAGRTTVLRLAIAGGKVESAQPGAGGDAARCLAEQIQGESDAFEDVPDGRAVVRLELSPRSSS